MKKNYVFILTFYFLGVVEISAQQLGPFVLSSSGGFYSNTSGMLSFTTAELTAVETYQSGTAILTQGFQQTFDIETYVTEHPDAQFSVGIYPNPSDGNFYLITETDGNPHVVVKILDLLGRQILWTEFDEQSEINVHSFDLPDTAPGVYPITLSVRANDTSPENRFVIKVQIIR